MTMRRGRRALLADLENGMTDQDPAEVRGLSKEQAR